MKKKISRKDLIELRKKELKRKELESQVGKDLKLTYEKLDNWDRIREGKNPYVIAALNFVGTLVIFYTPYLAFSILVDYGDFGWVMQLAFWLFAAWSLISGQTIFDYLLKNHR